jgi:nucleoside-triphosphatase THEP1
MTTASTQPQESPNVEYVPWSVLGPKFIEKWGRNDPSNPQPEHLEIIGINGSGKSFLLCQIMAEMVRRRNSTIVFVATKPADGTVAKLGWPIVDSFEEIGDQKRVVFWPKTKAIGTRRKEYQEEKIQELLDNLWHEESNTIVVFDEFAYVEGLSKNMKDTLNMYLREGRSQGITCVMGKQRGQGVQRDMHSESTWKICFKIADRKDMEYVAEMYGNKKDFIPILQSLSKEDHEFLIQSKNNDQTYISSVDKPVSIKLPENRK